MAFDYDQALPLDVEESGSRRGNGVSVHDIGYASLGAMIGQRRTGSCRPETVTLAGLIYVHPGPGDRTNFLDEAVLLAERGRHRWWWRRRGLGGRSVGQDDGRA